MGGGVLDWHILEGKVWLINDKSNQIGANYHIGGRNFTVEGTYLIKRIFFLIFRRIDIK